MFEDHNDTIYDLFKERELIPLEQLQSAFEETRGTGKALAQVIIDSGYLSEAEILRNLADYLGHEYVDEVPMVVEEEVAKQVRPNIARMYGVVPLRFDDTSVDFLAIDPLNFSIVDDLTFSLNKDINLVVGDPPKIEELLYETYGQGDSSIDDLLGEFDEEEIDDVDDDISDDDLNQIANQTPIIRFVNLILQQAIKDKASDVHFEPFEDQFRIRYRIDGALYEMSPPPKKLAVPVISRIKVIANLNIAEKRVPQDGRIKMTIAGRPVDLRVSTLPTQFGESVVLRVLDKSVVNLDLESLSLPDDILENIRRVVRLPNGIFIVTGPTGSGKTTTLYSALREINTIDTKILTAEDPIEYEIDGIMQVAVNHQVGLDFAKALRSFLRQDPDKIMVGEIRDRETAVMAVQAALTGHLVFSTLHTNDTASTVSRLLDLGVEPFLLSSVLHGILAQRLLRKVCHDCAAEVLLTPEQIMALGIQVEPGEDRKLPVKVGQGCVRCRNTGLYGRTGVFEMLNVNTKIRKMIAGGSDSKEIGKAAQLDGMTTLRQAAIRKLATGVTTYEEVFRVTSETEI